MGTQKCRFPGRFWDLLLTGAWRLHIGIGAEANNRALGGRAAGTAVGDRTSAPNSRSSFHLPAPASPTPGLGALHMSEGMTPAPRWAIPGASRAQQLRVLPGYSQGAAGLGVLLAAPQLQEVQHVLGQLLVVVQDTLMCTRGQHPAEPSTPQKPPSAGASPGCKAPGPAGAAPALWASSWGHGVGGSQGPCKSS